MKHLNIKTDLPDKFINRPFVKLLSGTKKAIEQLLDTQKDRSRFTILSSPTGSGKSFIQDINLRELLTKKLPNIKIILRLCPTRDVADDGIYTQYHAGWKGYGFHTPKSLISQLNILIQGLDNTSERICLSMTHSVFIHENEDELIAFLKKYRNNIMVVIEEVHKFCACPIPGKEGYALTMGRKGGGSPYHAKLPIAIREWMSEAPYVIGFTATPTKAQLKLLGDINGVLEVTDKSDKKFKYYYDVLDCYPDDIKDLIPHQAWLQKSYSYDYIHREPDSIVAPLEESIKRLLKKEEKLKNFKGFDDNITPKRVFLGVFGRETGSGWGASPTYAMKTIISYLKKKGFDNEPYIAKMTEKGCFTYDLNGDQVAKYKESDLVNLLNDPDNPVRFLLVINKATAGLNIHRISEIFVGRVRDLDMERFEASLQTYGRGVRVDVGTEIISKREYENDIRNYINLYHQKTGVDLGIIAETIKLSNSFCVTFPKGLRSQKKGLKPTKQDIWGGALKEFLDESCNTLESGAKFLDDFLKINGIEICPICGSKMSTWSNVNDDYEYSEEELNPITLALQE